MSANKVSRDTVFIAGGQPSITYVDRKQLDMERHVLDDRQYIWLEGGQSRTSDDVWQKICYELNYPVEITKGTATKTGVTAAIRGLIFSATGSQLSESETKRKYTIDSLASATRHLIENDIALIIDDFHYLDDDARQEFLRNVKGSVFAGLHVVLLSVTHRTFDAIKAETELTGRFISVTVPEWSKDDLSLIPAKGFAALNISCPRIIMDTLAGECQSSPFLMQKLCWEICYDLGVDLPAKKTIRIPGNIDLQTLYTRIAKDSGLPIYERLVAGPQIRKDRMKRPLRAGGDADVYQATLLAIAETGPVCPSQVPRTRRQG